MPQIHVRKVLVCIQWKSMLHGSGTPWDTDFCWMTSLKTDIYIGFYLCLLIDFVHTQSSSWLYNTRLRYTQWFWCHAISTGQQLL